jgi:hypothetical protein
MGPKLVGAYKEDAPFPPGIFEAEDFKAGVES